MRGLLKVVIFWGEVKVRLHSFLRAESGATAMEYVLLAGLIAIGILVGVNFLGVTVSDMFDAVAAAVMGDSDV